MNNFRKRLKRKFCHKNVLIIESTHTFILPFKELPSIITSGEGSFCRIDAHDLFSHYTADIIKEYTVFAR